MIWKKQFCWALRAVLLSLVGACSNFTGIKTVSEELSSKAPHFEPPATITCPAGSILLSPGQNLQAAVDAHPTGSSFCIQAGIHRMQSIIPKEDDIFTGETGAIMNGSKLLTVFSVEGNYHVATGQTQEGVQGGAVCRSGIPRCDYPEDFFYDDRPLLHVANLSDVGPGKWFFDYTNDKIYFYDSPAGHKIETSVTANAFNGSVNGITIRNLIIEKYATPTNSYAYAVVSARAAVQNFPSYGWLVEDNEIRWNHAAGVCVGSEMQMRRNNIHHNAWFGLVCGGESSLVENNEVAYNNPLNWFDYGWAAGGSKFVLSSHLTLRDNYVHHNEGPGLWADIDNSFTTYEGNHIVDNKSAGIFHEISYDAIIRNNLIESQTRTEGGNDLWFGGAIVVSASVNVEVYGNTIINSKHGLVAIDANRGVSEFTGRTWNLKNLYVHHNTVINPSTTAAGLSANTSLGNAPYRSWNNRFENNTYTLENPDATQFVWETWYVGTTDWKAFGNDVNGVWK